MHNDNWGVSFQGKIKKCWEEKFKESSSALAMKRQKATLIVYLKYVHEGYEKENIRLSLKKYYFIYSLVQRCPRCYTKNEEIFPSHIQNILLFPQMALSAQALCRLQDPH